MALITCIECGRSFSIYANACPNCGCPTRVSQEAAKEHLAAFAMEQVAPARPQPAPQAYEPEVVETIEEPTQAIDAAPQAPLPQTVRDVQPAPTVTPVAAPASTQQLEPNTMDRQKEIVKTSLVGIGGNLLLVAAKATIGIMAGAVSIVTDAVNNLTDVLSSIVTVVGARLSVKRPNKKHPYGYGRIEFVTSSIIAMLIFVAGAMAIYESIESLINKDAPTYTVYSFVVIAIAVAVKVGLGLFFRVMGKKTDSGALRASGLDALLDSLLSFGTLIGAVISYFTGVHLEGYIGILIGLFMIKSSIDVFRESGSQIIGERADPDFVSQMTASIAAMPQVYGVYDLIVNNYGVDRNIASVHIEVDGDLTAKEIQLLEREIAYICYTQYQTIMTVGIYARNDQTPAEQAVREVVYDVIAQHPEIIQAHGFFVDEASKTISIDIIINFECDYADDVYDDVHAELHRRFPGYAVHIVLDRDYSLT